MNTFGKTLTLTTYGESHGPAIGGIIDGYPAGVPVDLDKVQQALDGRRPGGSSLVSRRQEADRIEVLSGIAPDGRTLGTPIGFLIRNADARPGDYDSLKDVYRPNHADYTTLCRYGIRDHRGGGRASARETANWVSAGAFAEQLLTPLGIIVEARLESVGNCSDYECMRSEIEQAAARGDSIGGTVSVTIEGIPAGVGDPVFDKLSARLAAAMMSINGVKGFEIGAGFKAAKSFGSDVADRFTTDANGRIITVSNFSGGIQGGISNGMPVTMRLAFKPTPTIASALPTVDTEGNPAELKAEGRHDPCIAVRGVHVAKAMASLVIADAMLSQGLIPRVFSAKENPRP